MGGFFKIAFSEALCEAVGWIHGSKPAVCIGELRTRAVNFWVQYM
jgi:hypothetical protein